MAVQNAVAPAVPQYQQRTGSGAAPALATLIFVKQQQPEGPSF